MREINYTDNYKAFQVAAILKYYGHTINVMPYWCPFDLLMDDKVRIEVKAALPTLKKGYPLWRFNIHRHNQLKESEVDFYILRFEKIPDFKIAVHALLPSPIKKTTLEFTLRSLIKGRIAKFVKDFESLDLEP